MSLGKLSSRMPRKKLWAMGLIILLLVIFIVSAIYIFSDKKTSIWSNKHNSDAKLGIYKQAAISAMGQECSEIGVGLLKKGGNAIDAAIGALLCEGVASLHSMGLGGGFLMTIWNSTTKEAHYLDARETASRHATSSMFGGNPNLSYQGGLSVAVPGELLGYWEAHQKFGKLNWKDLFLPTIKLCQTGSRINSYLSGYIKSKEHLIRAEPTLSEILIDSRTNELFKEGDRIKRPQLAKTLEILSDTGITEFYNGTIAQMLTDEIQAFKGIIDLQDFKEYRVSWKEPIKVNIGKMTIYSAPPPGSGVLVSFIIKVLENFLLNNDKEIIWHRVIETFKWAYAKRTELGDPDFEKDVENLVKNFTSADYAKDIRRLINDTWTSNDPNFYGAVTSNPEDHGTCHVSVLDADGNAVSVTSTINQVFGAMFRSSSTGIIFNDEMDDFSSPNITNAFGIPPSPVNFIKPGKRPLSSMSPTIIVDENNQVRLVIGAAGGTKITTAVALAIMLNIWADYNVKEAVDAYRVHHQLFPMTIQYENGFPQAVLNHLRAIKHNATTYTGIGSAITAIAKNKMSITAISDYRRQGTTAGY
ncbi:glutathione hydrolase 1 proenzyme-like isoform X2 [Leptopilina heterotoma]|uniref:glutathione hydrolase 1 proenzyme-like isoform X2 n=1 Tax=Leptopilina heterotoma TaxID=63436 RepID=UPI001CA7EEF9|nr:glutathione hydrolase 1 proenzyme-like isoform X2 [Leptopilina heterotoma]